MVTQYGDVRKCFPAEVALKPDLRMRRTKESLFQVEAAVCANFLGSKHAWFGTDSWGTSGAREPGGLGDKAGAEAVTEPHYSL